MQSDVGDRVHLSMDEDIFDRKGRLARIGIAVLFSGAITFLVMNAIIHSGKGPQKDPVGQGSVVIMSIAMFLLVASTAHKLITRVHEARKAARKLAADASDLPS